MGDLKRRPSKTTKPKYPAAEEVLKHRREFLALVAKGALGVGVLGVIGCDAGGEAGGEDVFYAGNIDTVQGVDSLPGIPDGINPPDTHTWDSGGIQPDVVDVKPDEYTVAGDIGSPPLDTFDLKDVEDWEGPMGVPPMPDTIEKDTCPYPTDTKDDGNIPLPGEPPMPDVVEAEDVHDDAHEDVLKMKDFSPAGFMPYPEE